MFLLISHFCTAPTLCGSLSASRSGAARQRAEFQLEFRKKGPIFSLSPSPQRQQKKMRGGGEIVEVQGGHIVRSACRKDRHSKVCTAKGTRDRRVRLSARTAIQFYDVQDRLGYDRPSKAVDWLIKNAKAAIDELAELPAAQEKHSNKPVQAADGTISPPSNFAVAGGDGVGGENSSFLPPSLASDAISDTINSFFPVTAGASYSSNRYQDLRLSLQSFQNPILYHNSAVFSGHGHFSFNAAAPCNMAGCGDGGGYDYSVLLGPAVTPQPLAFGRSQFFAEGGTLQSSNSPSAPTRTDLIEHNLHPTASSSGGDCLPEFHFRAWTQGEDEHNGITDKPSSVSCGPNH